MSVQIEYIKIKKVTHN